MSETDAESAETLPTVLIVTETPRFYRAIYEGLGLTTELRSQRGSIFDTGVVDAAQGRWRVVMPTSPSEPPDLDFDPSGGRPLIVVAVAEGGRPVADAHLRVPRALMVASHVPMSARLHHVRVASNVLKLVERLKMRGGWQGRSDSRVTLDLSEEVAMLDASTCSGWLSVAQHDDRAGLAVLVEIHHPDEGDVEFDDRTLPAFLRALLKGLDPADFSQPSRPPASQPPLPAPPTTSQRIDVPGSIARFEMRALRMFASVVWQNAAPRTGWHVILGDNASGKTSLLRALALCLLDRSERDALLQGWDTWLRTGATEGSVRIDLATNGTTQSLDLALRRTSPSGRANGTPVVDVQSSERLRFAGFLAAYGPFRRFTGGDAEWVKNFKAHPRLQSVLTLFDERAALSDALEWLKDLWVRSRTKEPTPPEADFLRRLLALINETGFLPDGVVIEEPDADGVWCRDGNGLRVLAIDLSDGYRAVLSLALDLLRRLSFEHGYDGVFADASSHVVGLDGVVLIDEVDAHLHPTWQQRIGMWFKERFPRVQFFVATHSPIVCQAADSVLLLPAPGDDSSPRMATREELDRLRYGDLLDAFATSFFGERVTRSPVGRDKLQRLAELNDEMLARELSTEEQAEQERLRRELGTAGPVPPTEAEG